VLVAVQLIHGSNRSEIQKEKTTAVQFVFDPRF